MKKRYYCVMESISFQYPTWYIFFCVLLGLTYAAVLYFRDKTFQEQSAILNWGLGSFRFISVSLLSLLLLSPLLKSIITNTKKPVVILAQDQSESVSSEMSEEDLVSYQQSYQSLKESLNKDYELLEYSFGEEVKEGVDFEFTDKVSNISDLLTTIYDMHSNQNLGAVVLATDGIYNKGSNPVYASTKLSVPIYTVALGDTTPRRDLILRRVFHNRIAYLGDKFTIQVDIAAQNCGSTSSNLNVYKIDDQGITKIQQMAFQIDRNDYFNTQEIVLDADKSGVQRYRISLGQIDGEVTTANNSRDIFVDVLDARQKILILANSPHPDISALKQTISQNKNYEVAIDYISNSKENVASYDFVILHQLPSNRYDAGAVLNVLNSKKIPRMFILGSQTNFTRFNQAQSILTIRSDGRNTNEVQGRVAGGFNLFTLDEQISQQLLTFAPLTAPFGEFDPSPDAQILLYQRIGKIDTGFPLLIMGDINNNRVGILCAEGIWKWRLFDYLQHQNHGIFEEVIGKTIQYVSLKEDKRKFRVNLNQNIFNENEPIEMDAELYNDSYELINEPDASLVIRNSGGKEFNFTFNRSTKAYQLNAGIFPVGNYTFTGSVFSSGENLSYEGQFSVQPIQLELYETTADHSLLRMLSDKYGGELIYPAQLSSVDQLIREKSTIKPVIYQTSKNRSIINLKWIFFLLILLLTAEWFFRRYFGGY